MHVVLIEPEAKNDISQTIASYDIAKEGLGGEFLEELNILLNRIAENPRLYVHYRRRAHKAVMRRFPYLVFYRFDDTQVVVAAVMHGKRSLRAIKRRLKPTG